MIDPKASALVLECQHAAAIIRDSGGDLNGLLTKFQLSGDINFVRQHFYAADGNPREDIFITEEKFTQLIAAMAAIRDVINTHMAILVQTSN